MNKVRRKELRSLVQQLNKVQNQEDIYDIINELENIKDDEEMYYDNIPENLQSSQRAYDSEEAIESLNDALDLLNDACEDDEWADLISQAINKINEVI